MKSSLDPLKKWKSVCVLQTKSAGCDLCLFMHLMMDWMLKDIVDVTDLRKDEYEHFIKVLLAFVDLPTLMAMEKQPKDQISVTNPNDPKYFRSDRILDFQWLLSDVLEDHRVRMCLLSAVCALERPRSIVQLF
ncbi:hypothetical protein ACOME3_008531 [Neoechinorhynchus agilis]